MDRRSWCCPLLGALVLVVGGCAHGGSVTQRTVAGPILQRTAVRRVILGHSVEGRPIRGYQVGAPTATRRLLVVGCVHGNETAGEAITRRLRTATPVPGVLLWVVDQFNPDGCAAKTRQNADGVDLNRNTPWHWRHLGGTFYSGPSPLSEPESRAINKLVRCLQPQVSIWYHQAATLVDDSGGARSVERRYAHLVGLPFRHFGLEPGSITSWQNAAFPRDTAFVVELPAGRLTRRSAARHVSAVKALARAIPPPPGSARASCQYPTG
jgi:protein MpaA